MEGNTDLIKILAEHKEKYGLLGGTIFSKGFAMGYSTAMEEAREMMNKIKEALEDLRKNIEDDNIKEETDNSL